MRGRWGYEIGYGVATAALVTASWVGLSPLDIQVGMVVTLIVLLALRAIALGEGRGP